MLSRGYGVLTHYLVPDYRLPGTLFSSDTRFSSLFSVLFPFQGSEPRYPLGASCSFAASTGGAPGRQEAWAFTRGEVGPFMAFLVVG